MHFRVLLSSPNVYHLNLSEMIRAQKIVNELVRLDRLPTENPVEGLLLLRSAWRDYDVAMHLGSRYKRTFKLSFALQLLLGYGAITCATVSEYLRAREGDPTHVDMLIEVVFAISISLSVIQTFDSLLNAKSRWRQLRASATALESLIWCYRTRVGAFELEETLREGRRRPEAALMDALKHFREELIGAANLGVSDFRKRHPPSVYKHFQDSGTPKADADDYHDDYQSPVQPHRYIALRIKPTMTFYERRIPRYTCRGLILKLAIFLFGVASSILARYGLVSVVVMATAASAAVTSWAEFSDVARKAERYTRATNSLHNLLDWWASLGEVERASKTSINHLICSSEAIIAEEQHAWTSVTQRGGVGGVGQLSVSADEGLKEPAEWDPAMGRDARGGSRVWPAPAN